MNYRCIQVQRHGDDVTIWMNLREHRNCLSVDYMSESTKGREVSKRIAKQVIRVQIGLDKSKAYAYTGGAR